MNKIPADRYRAPLVPADPLPPPGGSQPPPAIHAQTHTQRLKDEWARKLFGAGDRERSETVKKRGGAKDAEKKVKTKHDDSILLLVTFQLSVFCIFPERDESLCC